MILINNISHCLKAQSIITQTVRGQVIDVVSKTPLIGANIVLADTNPLLGSISDENGYFKITQVPTGTYQIKISYLGYVEKTITQVSVASGKEVVLNVEMEEQSNNLNEVVIISASKNKPINDLALVSTRSFSVEETQKFAAAVNDPARMVTAYAGVAGTDDGNNSISIRGNTPNGLLWRLEGIDIPNPNHFANTASSGGGIMILSAQLLANSDFSTGAFSAEYGNALSGVFDIKLRKGNNEKQEHTLQVGVLGIDVATEGPFSKKYKGSYLVNYRYSTLSLLEKAGLNLSGGASTNFQDLSFNIHLPTKKIGNFSMFGFGGLSKQFVNAPKDSALWKIDYDRVSWAFLSNTGAMGIKHNYIFNEKTYLQSALVFSGNENGYEENRMNNEYINELRNEENNVRSTITASTVINVKLNSKLYTKSGVYFNQLFFNLQNRWYNEDINNIEERIAVNGKTQTIQFFNEWSYKPSSRWTIVGGIHTLHLVLNNKHVIEPRIATRFQINEKSMLNVGYGLHSQLQPLGNYFVKKLTAENTFETPNKDLDFTKSNHFVVGYTYNINRNLYVKAESYIQRLYRIPVSMNDSSTNALINREWGFETEPLGSNGVGRNMGLELTVEQFMHKGYYYLLSGSIYDAKYRAADGNWYNTRYNGRFTVGFTAGKEFTPNRKNKNRTYGINIKGNYNGGFRTTPIDVQQSIEQDKPIYKEKEAYTIKLPNYFRADIRISMKRVYPKVTHTASIDIQNVINRRNVLTQFYNGETQKVETIYQNGLIPVLSYRLEF